MDKVVEIVCPQCGSDSVEYVEGPFSIVNPVTRALCGTYSVDFDVRNIEDFNGTTESSVRCVECGHIYDSLELDGYSDTIVMKERILL